MKFPWTKPTSAPPQGLAATDTPGAHVTKADCKPVLIHIPKRWMPAIDAATGALDLDRSKFLRHAIREKLTRHGVEAPGMN